MKTFINPFCKLSIWSGVDLMKVNSDVTEDL